jgi:nucleolar MIF4G domain-containing protein 1
MHFLANLDKSQRKIVKFLSVMKPLVKHTTKLPQKMLLELEPDSNKKYSFRFKKMNRKSQRKQVRLEKKSKKQQFHSKGKSAPLEELKSIPEAKPIPTVIPKVILKPNVQKQLDNLETKNAGFYNVLLQSNLIDSRPPQSNPTQEDEQIKELERKLKIKKGTLGKGFKEDGLDYLLGFGSDENEGEELDIPPQNDSEFEVHELDSEQEPLTEGEESNDGDSEMDDAVNSDTSENSHPLKQKTKSTTDIYGGSTGETKKYVPPHLRNEKSDKYTRLKRQLHGLLNRLASANMESIVQGVSTLLLSHPRHDVTEIITDLVLELIGDSQNLLDSFCCTFGCFLAILFHLIGMEFGAHLTQTVVQVFLKYRDEHTGKQSTNYATLLAYLYTFQVVGCPLMYDLIKQSLGSLTELDVEILLRFVKTAGHQLRTDDPSSLKEIIIMLHTEIQKRDPNTIRFFFLT